MRTNRPPASHRDPRLMLLGSPPDMVHRLPLRETGTSTRMPAEDILSSKRIIHDSPAECKRKFLQARRAQVVILNAKEHEAPKAGRDSSSAIIFCEGIDVYVRP